MNILIGKLANFCIRKEANTLIFIPHGGCFKDGYSIINYASDNALSLLRYIINYYGSTYKYRVAVDYKEVKYAKNEIRRNFPGIDINFFPFFFDSSVSKWDVRKAIFRNLFNVFFRGTFFFTSEAISFPFKLKRQTLTYLGYYIPFKNDYMFEGYLDKSLFKTYDICVTTSLLSSQIISHTYNIPLYKFHSLGFSRNDELLNSKKVKTRVSFLKDSVDYEIKKVFLYTPTHRDYEKNVHSGLRNIWGFHVDKEKLAAILREYGAVIVCKLHSKQNIEALKREVPMGVLLHQPNSEYGLCELMQFSDYLITDYTSAYFDYLLLNRPVLFNFYDYDKYKATRGFAFDPLNSIIAGDIFTDEQSFLLSLNLVLSGMDRHAQKRVFVRDLLHKFVDNKSSERIFELVLKKK